MHRLAATIYWLALVAWFASLVAAAATATAAFTALPELKVAVPSAELVYPGADEASSRFAAGFVAQPIFGFFETIQLVAAPIVAVSLILQRSAFGWPQRSWLNAAREASLAAAIVLAIIHTIVLAPRLATEVRDYRNAVSAGDAASAAVNKEIFDRDHRRADPLLRTTAALLLVGLTLSAWTLTPRRAASRGEIQAPRVIRRG